MSKKKSIKCPMCGDKRVKYGDKCNCGWSYRTPMQSLTNIVVGTIKHIIGLAIILGVLAVIVQVGKDYI